MSSALTTTVDDAGVQKTCMPKNLPGASNPSLHPTIAALLDEDLPQWVKQAQTIYEQIRGNLRPSLVAPDLVERNTEVTQLSLRQLAETSGLYKEADKLRAHFNKILATSPTEKERALAEEGLSYINGIKTDKDALLSRDSFSKASQ
jgi:hypothetical protein